MYSRGTGGSSAAGSAWTEAARATTGIRVVGACVQLGAETKDSWENTGHVDMLAALGAVGVGGGRGYDGDCRGLSRREEIERAETQKDGGVGAEVGVSATDCGEEQCL